MKICENCKDEHNGEYASGRFCSKKCARGFSTKAKRSIINKKVSKTLKEYSYSQRGTIIVKNKCENCGKEFKVLYGKRKQKTCSKKCGSILKWKNPEYREKASECIKKRCNTLKGRKHMRDIGRKGGFGKRGITKNGTRYESLLEKEIFEYLEEKNILFEPHKHIPNSSKISDVYLIKENLWIEIDGINREKRKKWLGKNYEYWLDKLKIYKREKLNYKIIYNKKDIQSIN